MKPGPRPKPADQHRTVWIRAGLTAEEAARLDAVLHPSLRAETARGLLLVWVRKAEREKAKGAKAREVKV